MEGKELTTELSSQVTDICVVILFSSILVKSGSAPSPFVTHKFRLHVLTRMLPELE